MNYFTKRKVVIWLIVILLITNISTLGTFTYKAYISESTIDIDTTSQIEIPRRRMGRFYRDHLDLNREQHFKFRDLRQNFNSRAREITRQMADKRREMLQELSASSSDTLKLNHISEEIGKLHKELKQETIDYYLNMKKLCSPEQQKKLSEIFNAMNNSEVEIRPRMRRNQNRFRQDI
jgi:Spy/CpxP family protein refolding chaperone